VSGLRTSGLALLLGTTALVVVVAFPGCSRATYDTHDDFTVATEVKIALIEDRDVGALRVNAAADHGVVTLSGTVRSQADVDRAIRIARKVRGVRNVKSELKIAAG
jgi:hyperosmotically inducible protein